MRATGATVQCAKFVRWVPHMVVELYAVRVFCSAVHGAVVVRRVRVLRIVFTLCVTGMLMHYSTVALIKYYHAWNWCTNTGCNSYTH